MGGAVKRNCWHSLDFSMAASMTLAAKTKTKTKCKNIEVLTDNYPIS
jgi:hypothetical protein